ncbi:MAG: hypothetical protein RKO24_17400 [Candidatus Competibacter sp.]|nr:hypothetical protein [Candidatus Competibacter sp.]
MNNGQCVVEPNCDVGMELINHQCVSVCAEGQKRNGSGICVSSDGCPTGEHREGLSCVANNPPDLVCPPGFVKDGDNCEMVPATKCPDGTVASGEQCISVVNPSCPGGTHFSGGACVSDKPPLNHCPAGTHPVGQSCDSDSPPDKSCPGGSHLDGSNCVLDSPPDNQSGCPSGSHQSGNSCVSDAPPNTSCPTGQHLVGNVCAVDDNTVVKTCDDGFTLTDGKCVSGESAKCSPGQHLEGDKCVTGKVADCPVGSRLSGNVCVANPGKTCESGYSLVGDKCVSDGGGVNPGKGNGDNGSSGDGDGESGKGNCDPSTEDCGQSSGVAPFSSIYEKKGLEFSKVWGAFVSRVQDARIVSAGASFFTLGSVGGVCPVWVLPQSRFWHSYTFDLLCRPEFTQAFQIVSVVILLICAIVAFEIAFL